MKKISLTLLSLSSFILLFFTACQKDEMDKGGSDTGILDNQVLNQKNRSVGLIKDSIEFNVNLTNIDK